MNLPNAMTLRVFHDAQLKRFGGAPGLRDPGLLESAVGRVHSAMGYDALDVAAVAAMLCHAILKNHAFVDGNKRTAYGGLVMVLRGNGWRLEAEDMEIAGMIIDAAGSSDGYEAIADWLRPRIRQA